MNPLLIRRAEECDLLHSVVGGPAGEYRRQLSAVMNSDDGVVFLAELDGEIIGRITVGISGQHADISGFVVIKRCRRQGIGTTLMDEAEAEARRLGCSQLRLAVAKSNAGALALYGARGYQRVAQGMSAGLRTPRGIVVHSPEPVWEMVKPVV